MSAGKDPGQSRANPGPAPVFRRIIAGFLLIAVVAGAYAATVLL